MEIFDIFRIPNKKNFKIFFPKLLFNFEKIRFFFLQNIDKNIKNPTSDALDFVKLALLRAPEKQFQ